MRGAAAVTGWPPRHMRQATQPSTPAKITASGAFGSRRAAHRPSGDTTMPVAAMKPAAR